MKTFLSVLALTVLTGCAATVDNDSRGQRQEADLRKPLYLQVERQIPLTFPEIQMALIKHERLCGAAPIFSVNEGQTAFGKIVQFNDPDQRWDQAILMDLTWLQPTWRQETRVRAQVYSRYTGRDFDQRLDRVFRAIFNPDVCSGQEEQASEEGAT